MVNINEFKQNVLLAIPAILKIIQEGVDKTVTDYSPTDIFAIYKIELSQQVKAIHKHGQLNIIACVWNLINSGREFYQRVAKEAQDKLYKTVLTRDNPCPHCKLEREAGFGNKYMENGEFITCPYCGGTGVYTTTKITIEDIIKEHLENGYQIKK